MQKTIIPPNVATIVGNCLGPFYYSHRQVNNLFIGNGAPGDPPEGSCGDKITAWLLRSNETEDCDSILLLGKVLEYYMDNPGSGQLYDTKAKEDGVKLITGVLARHGFTYQTGGVIIGARVFTPTRSLEKMLKNKDLGSLDIEFKRALESIEKDPPAALTSACAILEALCKVYIHDEGLEMPSKQTIKPLWDTVSKHLGFDPSKIEDDDIKRIVGGFTSVIDGLGAFRTHAGSAHGHGRNAYKAAPRHARLAIHAAHTLSAFVLETWRERKKHG